MAYQHYRSPFGDTTFTKVFVGGLAWETLTDAMRNYFEQFGEILEAVIILDKNTGKSKGYGFVTFRDPESARRACADPNPMIDGRRANCNVASMGRPRPSPPRGRFQGGGRSSYQGGGGHSGVLPPPPPLVPTGPTPVMYPPYGYQTYTHDYGYHQAMYNTQQQYFNQMYGTSTSNMGVGSPYYYGYPPMQASRATYPAQHQRIQLYYPTQQMEGSSSSFSALQPTQPPSATHHAPSTSSDSMVALGISTESEAQVVTSESSLA